MTFVVEEFVRASRASFGTPFVITTVRNPAAEEAERARRLSAATGQVFYERAGYGLPKLFELAKRSRDPQAPEPTGIYVVGRKEDSFWHPSGESFVYHPGMAVHRIQAIADGRGDPMVAAMELLPGDTVLDCTAGLCSDALVASYVVGTTGKVRALESSLPVGLIVGQGLAVYTAERRDYILPAMRRIELRLVRASEYLAEQPADSWDIVYFDPMFHNPVRESTGIAALRLVADPAPLQPATLRLAARAARRAVVVKDRQDGPWFTHSRFTRTVAGRGRIGYAVLAGDELKRVADEGWPET